MFLRSSRRASHPGRQLAGKLALAGVILLAGPVGGQRLLEVIPQGTRSSSIVGAGLPPEVPLIAVQVDFELLRSEPVRLELPTPDGRILWADISVFEDRGGGDLMWAGRLSGADYDSVVLTVEGGRLVGWFGEPGGVRYRISARPGGGGQMATGPGPPGREPDAFCPVSADPDPRPLGQARLPAEAMAVDRPLRAGAAQNHEQLDILVVYNSPAALNWSNQDVGAQAAIRSAGDYLNMVLRNGGAGVKANIVHIAQIRGALDSTGFNGPGLYGTSMITQLRHNGEALRLRRKYGADLVHLFTGESPWTLGGCGQHYILSRNETAEDFSEYAYGWTSNACFDEGPIFAHEIGHGLGAHHDPPNGGPSRFAVRPYAFGHGNHDHIPNAGTIMSYTGQVEPYLSSVRIRPHGRVVGIADERENERALGQTIHVGVQYGDFVSPLPADAPTAPTSLHVEMEDAESMKLSWWDNAPDADSYEVTFWRTGQAGEPTRRRVDDRDSTIVDLPVADAGTRYFFFVRAVRGETLSARSSIRTLAIPGAEPPAPSGIAWRFVPVDDPVLMGTHTIRVSWADNSDDESVFHVLLLDGFLRLLRRKSVPADSTSTLISRLAPGENYLVVVQALGLTGRSEDNESVEVLTPSAPGPTAVSDLTARATGDTSVRLTWTANSSRELGFRVLALVSGWFGLFEAEAGSESIEIEGLARGGSYFFGVWPHDDAGLGGRSVASLRLGALGRGPEAPTKLGWVFAEGVARLTWKDNSSTESGFEIQYRPEYETQDTTVVGGGRWTRVALVPANTTSFDLYPSEAVDYRVFAYSDAGFSRASNTVRGMPTPSGDPPGGGGGGVTAVPSGETAVELAWTGRWARAARGTLSIEARNPASDWVEVATATPTMGNTVVTGLEAETPYTFRLRAGRADYSPEVSVTTGAYEGACRPGSAYLCLRDGRFEVRAHWSKPDSLDEFGAGTAVPVDVSDESGLFWFFDPENIELVVKVLDGRAINGSYWVFFGALSDVEYWITVRDVSTGERRTYHNPPREVCGQKDLVAFGDPVAASTRSAAGGHGPGGEGIELVRMNAVALDAAGVGRSSHGGGTCQTAEDRLCLLDGRFSVEVGFVDPKAGTGVQEAAQVIPSLTTAKTGFFWFFNSSNIELAVKMLDGRALNGHFWLLYGGLSDVEYEITVTDTVTGEASTYRNEPGSICGQIDIEAF